MITINTAESALKNIYLETVTNDLNTKTNPFLTMIAANTKTVAGKDAKASVRFGGEDAVAAGTEDGPLPSSVNARQADIEVPLKNLYGSFQITDKAIKAAQNSPGAFASLLGGEMTNLVSTAQNNMNRMLYGNGRQLIGFTTQFNHNGLTLDRRFWDRLPQHSEFDAFTAAGEQLNTNGPLRITTAVGGGMRVFATLGSGWMTKHDRVYLYTPAAVDPRLEMNGIDSVFTRGEMYNLKTSEYPEILPFVMEDTTSSLNIMNEDTVIDFFDQLEERANGQATDIIMTTPMVRKALFENLRDTRNNIDVAELAGGFRGFTFNGVPLYADNRAMGGSLYALNSGSFAMHQLCDWTWLEGEDGSILRPQNGKPVYSASLVKYADLVCEKPFLQGKLTGFHTNAWRVAGV